MNKKKIILTVLAVALICTIAVTGTLAFLKEESASITNTFIGGSRLIDPPEQPDPTPEDPYDDNGFYILENGVTVDDLGVYSLDGDESIANTGNDYSVIPSTNLPKNPFVRIVGKTDIPAYLYIEVVDNLGEDSGLGYQIKDCWVDTGLTGKNGGTVYAYNSIVTDDVDDVHILVDDQITAGDDIDIPDDAALSFYGYLAQASAGAGANEGEEAIDAFTACFGD